MLFLESHNIKGSLVYVVVVGLCLWGILEDGYGLMQVLGWRSSRHALYVLTGHFQNPGPFGGFVACVMAVAGAWVMRFPVKPGMTEERPGMTEAGRWMARIEVGIRVLAWVALGMGLIVLPASMSRAGWLALVVALGVEALRQPYVRSWLHQHRWAVPASCLAASALLAGAFFLKPDSALGRLHIWRMELRAIAERPWRGAGSGMGPWAYGETQEAFFREHLETVSPATIRVAGCPEYAFNEYLGVGVEHGLPAMVLFVLLIVSSIVVLHKVGSPLAAGLTAWAVFAFSSYPLAVPQLRILGAVFVISAIVSGLLMIPRKNVSISLAVLACVSVGLLLFDGRRSPVKPGMRGETPGMTGGIQGIIKGKVGMKEEFRMVYMEGYSLHQLGRYEESTEVLARGAMLSCDPLFEIIMGKNAEALGDYERAAKLYRKAHYMVPSRLYPLVRLMRLQVRQGRDGEALETAREIVAMPVNERNAGMVRLHGDAEKALDSLETVIGR